jgi:L-fucose mutarotase
MLTTKLLHPDILQVLGSSGHGSTVLIADGNYPFLTGANPQAKKVYLNLSPGLVNATDVLKAVAPAIPVELATIMATNTGADAPIVAEFKRILPEGTPFQSVERFAFYELAKSSNCSLVIATGEQRIYANVILTIGVVPPPA